MPPTRDFQESASYMRDADLVISVDTSVLHLAGSMGVETWGLLPFTSEWRWQSDPDRTAWYPSVRLFRQDQPGNWSGVLARVEAALREKVATKLATGD